MLRLFMAECDRWNATKLIAGVAFTFCLMYSLLAAAIVLGWARFPNAMPRLHGAPLAHLIQNGLGAIALLLLFNWCERARRRAVGTRLGRTGGQPRT